MKPETKTKLKEFFAGAKEGLKCSLGIGLMLCGGSTEIFAIVSLLTLPASTCIGVGLLGLAGMAAGGYVAAVSSPFGGFLNQRITSMVHKSGAVASLFVGAYLGLCSFVNLSQKLGLMPDNADQKKTASIETSATSFKNVTPVFTKAVKASNDDVGVKAQPAFTVAPKALTT